MGGGGSICAFYIKTSLEYPSFFCPCGIIVASTIATKLMMSDFMISYIYAILNFTVLKYATRFHDIVTIGIIMSTRIYLHVCVQTQSHPSNPLDMD